MLATVSRRNRKRRFPRMSRTVCTIWRGLILREAICGKSGVNSKKFCSLTSRISSSLGTSRSSSMAASTPPNPPPSTTTRRATSHLNALTTVPIAASSRLPAKSIETAVPVLDKVAGPSVTTENRQVKGPLGPEERALALRPIHRIHPRNAHDAVFHFHDHRIARPEPGVIIAAPLQPLDCPGFAPVRHHQPFHSQKSGHAEFAHYRDCFPPGRISVELAV